MINKRLINTVKDSKKYIFSNVLCQWVSLLSNFVFVTCLALMIEKLWLKEQFNIFEYLIYMLISILVRAIMTKLSIRMGYLASKEVKKYYAKNLSKITFFTRVLQRTNQYKRACTDCRRRSGSTGSLFQLIFTSILLCYVSAT